MVRLDGAPIDSERAGRVRDGSRGARHLFAHGDAVGIAFDGRIDNDEDLRRDLAGASLRSWPTSDADVVLRAYERWGEACAAKLLGDFAFALWDGTRRTLFCARDITGVRPLYYCHDAGVLSFASELPPLVRSLRSAPRPDEGVVGEYLACRMVSTHGTLYASIRRLPPAHALVATSRGVRTFRYWEPPTETSVRHASDEDYAAHFREVFVEAVRCRLRPTRDGRHERRNAPIAIALSGGLDSSAVASVAASISTGAPPIAVSMVFPGRACDESAFIDEVVTRWRMESLRTATTISPETYREQAERFLDFPGYPNGLTALPMLELARSSGAHVLLTGAGGDDWLDGSSDVERWSDMLWSGAARATFAEIDRGNVRELRSVAAVIARRIVRRATPSALEPLRRRIALWTHPAAPTWMQPSFARRCALDERDDTAQLPPSVGFSAAAAYASGTSPWRVHAYELSERLARTSGLELRHPFDDRRVIELLMSVPPEVRRKGNDAKRVLRGAMQDVVPEAVRLRRGKAEFSHEFALAFDGLGGARAFRSLSIADAGWVDGRALERAFVAARGRDRAKGPWSLWMPLGIEMWFRAAFA